MNKAESVALLNEGTEAWNAWAKRLIAERNVLATTESESGAQDSGEASRDWHAKATVDFSDYCFERSVSFSDLIFPGSAHFDRASFDGGANFSKGEFQGDVCFNDAVFDGGAHFNGATFCGAVGFLKAIFGGVAAFESVTFENSAEFLDAHFFDDAWFGKTVFNSGGSFDRNVFWGMADFRKVRFLRDVGFQAATFRGPTEFGNAVFAKKVTFQDSVFLRGGGFGDVHFTNIDQDAFSGSFLWQANLSGASGLSQEHLKTASGTRATKLPPGLEYPAHWMERDQALTKFANCAALKGTPPVVFEWSPKEDRYELVPLPPGSSSGGGGGEIRPAQRNARLAAISKLARDAQVEVESSCASSQTSISGTVSRLLNRMSKECAQSGALVNPFYLREMLRELDRIVESEGFFALNDTVQFQLQSLANEGKKLLDFFPAFDEFDDAKISHLVPEELAVQAEELAAKLLKALESPDGQHLFGEKAVEVVRTLLEEDPGISSEVVATQKNQIVNQKRKIIRLGKLVASMIESIRNPPPSVKTVGEYSSILGFLLATWQVLAPYLTQ